MPLRRLLARLGPIFLIVAVQGALLSAPKVTLFAAEGLPNLEQKFVDVNSPVGLAVNPSGLGYVTRPLCGNPRQVLRFTSTGNVTVLATLPRFEAGDPVCFEHKIAVSPGPKDTTAPQAVGYPTPNVPGGFTSNEIYVTSPKTTPLEGGSSQKVLTILKIALDLNALINQRIIRYLPPTTFATFPSCNKNQSTGITFDEVGTFRNKLLITCSNVEGSGGQVWSVDRNGAKTQVGTISGVPGPFERPVVAPTTSPFGGNLLIPAENAPVPADCPPVCPPAGQVLSLAPPGFCEGVCPPRAASPIANIPSAEAVAVKLDTACNFGLFNRPQGATYFAAKSGATPGGNRIDFIPKAPFSGKSGQAFVISENAEGGVGIWQLTAPFTAPIPFSASSTTHEDAAFVDCFVPTLVRIKITGRNTPLLDVAIFSNGRFDAGNIQFDASILTPLNANPQQQNHPVPGSCKKNGDRDKSKSSKDKDSAKVKKADDDEGGGNDEEDENTVHCTFVNNLGTQHGVFKGPVVDPAGPGDPAEGGC